MSFRYFLPILCLALLTGFGCHPQRVYYLSNEHYPPTPDDQQIKLYVNEVNRPFVPIAVVQSFTSRTNEADTVRDQLKDVRGRARELGADAVIDVRQLKDKIRGYVVDEAVPFRAYEQGEYNRFFIRGTAIKFVEDEQEAIDMMDHPMKELPEPTDDPNATMGIPQIESRDSDEDSAYKTSPRGLAPPLP